MKLKIYSKPVLTRLGLLRLLTHQYLPPLPGS
jgi:hypothetical protein